MEDEFISELKAELEALVELLLQDNDIILNEIKNVLLIIKGEIANNTKNIGPHIEKILGLIMYLIHLIEKLQYIERLAMMYAEDLKKLLRCLRSMLEAEKRMRKLEEEIKKTQKRKEEAEKKMREWQEKEEMLNMIKKEIERKEKEIINLKKNTEEIKKNIREAKKDIINKIRGRSKSQENTENLSDDNSIGYNM